MRLVLFILFFKSIFAFGKEEICVTVKGDYPQEKYLRIALKRSVEKALIETGYITGCDKDSKKLLIIIKNVNEKPIAYTSKSRIRSFSLTIVMDIIMENKKGRFSSFAPYGQPSGGIGDINRKKAIDEIIDKIYLDILKFLSRR